MSVFSQAIYRVTDRTHCQISYLYEVVYCVIKSNFTEEMLCYCCWSVLQDGSDVLLPANAATSATSSASLASSS